MGFDLRPLWGALAVGVLCTGCGGASPDAELTPDDDTADETPTVERAMPAFDGCGDVEPGFLAGDAVDAQAVRRAEHAIGVDVEPTASRFVARDVITVEMGTATEMILVQLDGDYEITGLATWPETPDAEPVSLQCDRGELTGRGAYVRIGLPEPAAPGDAIRIRIDWRPSKPTIERETPLRDPVETVVAAQLDADGAFVTGRWWPAVFGARADSNETVALDVTAPESWHVASPRLDGVALGPGTRLAVAATDAVVEPRGSAHTPVQTAFVATGAPDLADMFHAHATGMAVALGAWRHGPIHVVKVRPQQSGMLDLGLGVVLIDEGTLGSARGEGLLNDALARQFLVQDANISSRLQPGLISYLTVRVADDVAAGRQLLPSEGGADLGHVPPPRRLGEATARYLDALASPPEGGEDVAIVDLSMLDAMYVQIAYGKVPLALAVLEATVGRVRFDAALRRFVAHARTAKEPADVEALIEELGADGKALATVLFEWPGAPTLDVDCTEGTLSARWLGPQSAPPRAAFWARNPDDDDGEPVRVELIDGEGTVDTELCAQEGATVMFDTAVVSEE